MGIKADQFSALSEEISLNSSKNIQGNKSGVNVDDLSNKLLASWLTKETLKYWNINTKGEPKGLLNVEFISSSLNLKKADIVLDISDNSICHIEFQKSATISDLRRIRNYNVFLDERFPDRPITTYIIYASKIKPKKVIESLIQPSLNFCPNIIYTFDKNGDQILSELRLKIQSSTTLTEKDLLDMGLLLSFNSSKNSKDMSDELIELTHHIDDVKIRTMVQTCIITMAKKYVNPDYAKKLENRLKVNMLEIEKYIDDYACKKFAEYEEKGLQKGLKQLQEKLQQGQMETAKMMLNDGQTIENVKKYLPLLDDAMLQRLKKNAKSKSKSDLAKN